MIGSIERIARLALRPTDRKGRKGSARPLWLSAFRGLVLALWLVALFSQPLFAEMSVQEERELSEKLLRQVIPQVRLVKDPEITSFVARIGRNILDVMGPRYFKYRFFVIEDDALNAFAMPGGLVFVHTGLIEAIDSENELACVLAHEFGHVRGRHMIRRVDNMKYVSIGTAIMALAGIFLGDAQATSAVISSSLALGQSIALKYSRADEQEADRRALEWICKAGYDPRGLITTLEKMQRNQWFGSSSIPKYLSTHPAPEERITYLEDYTKSHPCPERRKENRFLLKKIQVKLHVMSSDPLQLVKEYKLKVVKSPKDPLAWYGYALSLSKARRFGQAFEAFDKLFALARESVQFEPGHFELDAASAYYEAGRYLEAVRLLERYLAFHPEDDSAKFLMAKALNEQGQSLEAIEYFKQIEPRWDDDPEFLFHYGRTLAAAGQKGKAHYYFFKYYGLIGDSRSAAYHKRRALALLSPKSPLRRKMEGQAGPEESKGQEMGQEGQPGGPGFSFRRDWQEVR